MLLPFHPDAIDDALWDPHIRQQLRRLRLFQVVDGVICAAAVAVDHTLFIAPDQIASRCLLDRTTLPISRFKRWIQPNETTKSLQL
jgi:hypothetical protein